MGAIGEGIAIAPGGWVPNLRQAGGAGCRVRHHAGLNRAGTTGEDAKFPGRPGGLPGTDLQGIDAGQGRTFDVQAVPKALQFFHRSPQVDQHPGAVIAHVPRQAPVLGQPPDRRAKPHALHQPPRPDQPTPGRILVPHARPSTRRALPLVRAAICSGSWSRAWASAHRQSGK